MLSVRFKRSENFLFPDNLLHPAAELALENWEKQLPKEGEYFNHQFSEYFERKMRAIYMDE